MNLVNILRQNPEYFVHHLYQKVSSNLFQDRFRVSYLENEVCQLRILQELNRGKEGVAYLATDGQSPFVLKVSELHDLEIKFYFPELNFHSTGLCLYPNLNNLRYITCDGFTTEYIIGFFLNNLMYNRYSGTELNGVIRFLDVGICQNKGSLLLEYALYGDLLNFITETAPPEYRLIRNYNGLTLNTLRDDILLDIIKQVIANLNYLEEKVQFNHGDLKLKNILVTSEPSQVEYKGLTWNNDFTVKLTDFGKSSCNINTEKGPIRIFNHSPISDVLFSVFQFIPEVSEINGESYFQVDSLKLTLTAKLRHMGIPYYYSMDTYTFILSLMIVPQVFYIIMNSDLKRTIWDPLWFPEEANLVLSRTYQLMNSTHQHSYADILGILKGLKLKCNANSIILNKLKLNDNIS